MKDKIGIIIAKMKKDRGFGSEPKESDEGEMGGESEDYGSMGKESAAEAVLSAVKSGSASELASALTSFYDLCGSGGESEESEDE